MPRFLRLHLFGDGFRWLGRAASVLSSPLPPFGRAWRQEIALRVFRLALLLSALLYPLFGIVYHATHPGAVDPMWIRVALSIASLALVAASYRWEWVRQNAAMLLVGVAYVDLIWIAAVAYSNDLSRDYALGLYFVFVAAAVLSSLSFERTVPMLTFLVFGVVTAAIVGVLVPEPEVSVTLLLLCLVSTAIAMYVMVAGFLQALAILDQQYSAMVEAQEMAQVGSWEYCPRSHQVYWSEGLFALLGMDHETERPRLGTFLRRIAPEDQVSVVAALREAVPYRELTVALNGDGPRLARISCVIDCDAHGRPERYHGTVKDVTDEARREAALIAAREEAERAREAAEELAQLKSTLLANMSHEIRTPLTAIVGFAEMLVSEVDGAAREYVQLISHSGHRLMDTLNSVLDLARLRSGNVELKIETLDTLGALKSIAAMVSRQVREKRLYLRVDAGGQPPRVLADRSALDRVLTNLVSNALKFTDEGGITLGVEQVGGRAVFSVTDTGIGISQEFVPLLFDEFRQESEGLTRSHEGSGLGLAITRGLVELMGGEIRVTSEPGRGTTFTVSLPAVPDADAPESDLDAILTAVPPADAWR